SKAQAPVSRDTRVAASGMGEISGLIVTDEETPQPVKRAEVRAIVAGGEPLTTYTDGSGAFAFTNLPTGRYTVEATKPGYVRTAFGARRHDRPGTPITLTDAQRKQVLQMRMARGSVITGRIVDEFGQPAQGARVRAQMTRMVNGERTLVEVPIVGAMFGEAADDRGVYRLYGLPAGDYVISAAPRNSGLGDIRRMGESEIRAAEQAIKQPLSPLEPDATPAMVGYTSVFFPGVVNASQATAVTVKIGEERQGVDFAIQFVRTASVEGTLMVPGSVRPESVELLMVPRLSGLAPLGGTAMFIAGSGRRVGPDGRFSFTGVTPGAYTLSARVNQEGSTALWANADIDVDGQPIAGVTLSLQEGLTVAGRLGFEMDGVDPPTLFSRARLNLIPADNAGIMFGGSTTQVSASGAFSMRGVIPGRYRMTATFNTPEANWILKSAVIKGKDALDVPFDLAAGDVITDAVLTFTNRTQELSGTLQDAAKRPATDFTVVVFPADKTLWGAARRVRTTRPDTGGKFSFANLPAGSYRIAAVQDIGPEELRDPSLLEELAAASLAFTLADGEKKIQDLRLASGGR
ncbi:MAG: carboxypeptidase regulatory-like domain-containing protein, partial [Vicinamibacterales bacterium]